MPRKSQYIEFEGLFSEGVLGIFRIIRGFAPLRDLAEVSVPYKMEGTDEQALRVVGHQREESEKHAKDIKNYLEKGVNRFLPEVILSVRAPINLVVASGEMDPDDVSPGETVLGVQSLGDSLEISRRYSRPTMRMQRLRIRRSSLGQIKQDKLIRRIDGNHRLHFAEKLIEDPIVPSKYLASFCMVLLRPPDNEEDDYAESLIFHTINSTSLPLESEHDLRLILGQNPDYQMTPDKEFAYSPKLYLTRLLVEGLEKLTEPARQRFGDRPLTALGESARNLVNMDKTIALNQKTLENFADDLFAALADITTRLTVNHPSLCRTHGFFELAARVWREPEGDDYEYEQKVSWAVDYLDRIGHWLGSQGITNLLNPLSPAEQLLKTFKAIQSDIPQRVFLARWYPNQQKDSAADIGRAGLRLQQIKQMLTNIQQQHDITLELIDMGTEEGDTFPIHSRMYEAIASSDIIICDLSGQRANVYVEAGYALKHHESNRLIFLFEPRNDEDQVPFDLNTFKYVLVNQAAEIPNKVKPEIESILRSAGASLSGSEV